MMDNYSDLVAFLETQWSFPPDKVTEDTSLEDDLGITGDDAKEIIIKFSQRFVVNIDKFYFTQYFYPEPLPGVSHSEIKRLTVGHLLKAIAAGRLDEEIINS